MELVQEMVIRNNRKFGERTEVFQRINGVMFCKSCGKQYDISSDELCNICGGRSFIKGDFAAVLAGYIRLNKIGRLKEYYKNRSRKTSGANMNTRRMVVWLLIKDGFMIPGDKKTEDMVYRTLYKRW